MHRHQPIPAKINPINEQTNIAAKIYRSHTKPAWTISIDFAWDKWVQAIAKRIKAKKDSVAIQKKAARNE
jgi:hypothetical protein